MGVILFIQESPCRTSIGTPARFISSVRNIEATLQVCLHEWCPQYIAQLAPRSRQA